MLLISINDINRVRAVSVVLAFIGLSTLRTIIISILDRLFLTSIRPCARLVGILGAPRYNLTPITESGLLSPGHALTQ